MDNISKIKKYILDGCNGDKKIGMELEHFVCGKDFEIVDYEQVKEVLSAASQAVSAEKYIEDGHLLGYLKEDYHVSVEPGCQLEVSIAPKDSIEAVSSVYESFLSGILPELEKRNLKLVTGGVHPLIENDEIDISDLPLLPKKRYEYMDAYFENSGNMGRYMMRATASTQVSIDYKDEADALKKMGVLSKLAPVIGLLCETGGNVKNHRLFKPFLTRTQIWNGVDKKRSGYFPGSVSPDYSVRDYADYVYNTPLILMKEKGKTIELSGKSAADYYGDRELVSTEEHILSMFFPNVRLKKYIEYRVADSMPVKKALGYAAFITGFMYDESKLSKLHGLLKEVKSEQQIYEAEEIIEEHGYDSLVYGKNVCEWLCILFETALEGADENEAEYINALKTLPVLNYEYAQLVRGREKEHLPCGRKVKDYLLGSTAKYHERVVRTLYLPKLFTKDEVKTFSELVNTLYGIFEKVIGEYEKNSEYRALFGFDERLEKLILRPKKYDCDIPIARVDIFYNDETGEFKFCEFNTDGTSAMNEDRELNTAFRLSDAWQEFNKKYPLKSFELFDTWVDKVLALWKNSEVGSDKCGKTPTVAIVDFLESGTVNEFEIFRQRFEKRGVHALVCDIRNTKCEDGRCVAADGTQIDIIYRRAVTSDIMSHYDEVQGFIDAAVSSDVLLMGDFRTQIVHNKLLFKVLCMDETKRLLTKKEQVFVRAHVPMTMSLSSLESGGNEELKRNVLENKNSWIIKPEDSYGSKGVLAGEECDDEVWRKTVNECIDGGYILQEFVEPYRLRNIDLQAESTRWITTSNLTGLFVYAGEFQGCYSRVSFDKMISTRYNEMSLPTMIAEKQQ